MTSLRFMRTESKSVAHVVSTGPGAIRPAVLRRKNMKKPEMKWKAAVIAAVITALAAPAHAEMVSTDRAAGLSERDRVRDWVQREEAQKQLKAMGIAPETAQERVNAMTDEEVSVVAGKLDS